MFLQLHEAMERTKLTELEFFNTCYQYVFDKIRDCSDDVAQFKLHAIIPLYVQQFLRHYYHGK